MQVTQIQSGPAFRANTYILEENDEVALIDAGMGTRYGRLKRALGERRPAWVLLTHWHVDHVRWLRRIAADYGPLPVYCDFQTAQYITGKRRYHESSYYREESPWWLKPFWGMAFHLWPIPTLDAVTVVAPGDVLALGGENWEVIDLEGHTLGSIGLYHAGRGVLFSGDAVFRTKDGALVPVSYAFSVSRERVDATFARVQAMDIKEIYPGHYSCGTVRK
jgi:glyoxylase-like metal-dependent hydrolase (beta-lactamase superfamily II)